MRRRLTALALLAAVALSGCGGAGEETATPVPSQSSSVVSTTPAARSMLDIDPLREALESLEGPGPERIVATQQWIEAWFGSDVATYENGVWEDMPADPEAGGLDVASIDVDILPDIVRGTTVPCAPPVVVIESSPVGPTWRTGCDYWHTLLREDVEWFTNEAEQITELALMESADLETAVRQATAGSDGELAQSFIVFGATEDSFVDVTASFGGEMVTVRRVARDWEFPITDGSSYQDWTGKPTFTSDEVPTDMLLERFEDAAAEHAIGTLETAYVWVGEDGDILGRVVGTDGTSGPDGFVLVPSGERG